MLSAYLQNWQDQGNHAEMVMAVFHLHSQEPSVSSRFLAPIIFSDLKKFPLEIKLDKVLSIAQDGICLLLTAEAFREVKVGVLVSRYYIQSKVFFDEIFRTFIQNDSKHF